MKRRELPAYLAASLVAARAACAGERVARAGIVLPEAAKTSAGVFAPDGRLLRTLWSGRALPAGPVDIEWDGRDDAGEPVAAPGDLQVRLLAHRLRYEWEGVIGNTSDAPAGGSVHRSYGPIHDMAVDAAGHAFYVVGYAESSSALHRFEVATAGRRVSLGRPDHRRVFRYVATDGELAYFANIGRVEPPGNSFRGADTFVVAFRVDDGSEHVFVRGHPRGGDFHWESGVDYEMQQRERDGHFLDAPSGLAVQKSGSLLFVAHRGANQIRAFDKRDGRLLQTIAVESPGDLDMAPDDSLWVLAREAGRPVLIRFSPRGGAWVRSAELHPPVGTPLAIGVSPRDGSVAVVDAADDMVRAFDGNGRALWQLGKPGGYAMAGPEVTSDRFGFRSGPTYLAFQADGSFWLGDPGNRRNLKFSRDLRQQDQIQYLPHSYVASVDAAQPTRVFSNFLEFEVDYGKPLRRSWKLVRNWSGGRDTADTGAFNGIRAVATLPDGRSIAAVVRTGGREDELMELAGQGLRALGVRLRPDERLHADGVLRSHVIRGRELQVFERRIEGMDAAGRARVSDFKRLARVAALKDTDPWYHDVPMVHGVNDPAYPVTASGLVVSFNPNRSAGFHLGALRPGVDEWLWRASAAAEWRIDAEGMPLDRDGTYGVGHGVHYPASVVVATGAHLIYGYHGEGWNGGQANQWMHFHESGLFLGQFGEPAYAGGSITRGPKAGVAGNAFSPALVEVDGALYLWHNDESVHGGVHRWRVHGHREISVLSAPVRGV